MRDHASNADLPRGRFSATLVAVMCLVLACQNSPTGSDQLPDGNGIDSLRIVSPATLLVHDVALLRVAVWRSHQQVFDTPVTWESSDPATASLTPSGATSAVLTGHRLGTVTIRASTGSLVKEATLRVTAELRIQPDYVFDAPQGWPMAVGDRLQFQTVYVDVNGDVVAGGPSLGWSSSDPTGVSVTATGLVTALLPNHDATVTAISPDDTVRAQIRVLDVIAGQPATVRLVHAMPGSGPIRFLLSQGDSRSLSYGEAVELPVVSGTLRVGTDGMAGHSPGDQTSEFVGVVRPGDHLSLYAAGTLEGSFLQPAWSPTVSIPPDSALVRLVQSSPALVVDLRSGGEPAGNLPLLCYFDPGFVTDYFVRPAGDFEIIGRDKYGDLQEIGRTSATAAGGRAVTIVLAGGVQQPFSVLTFTDR
jgi:hypothetical protein